MKSPCSRRRERKRENKRSSSSLVQGKEYDVKPSKSIGREARRIMPPTVDEQENVEVPLVPGFSRNY